MSERKGSETNPYRAPDSDLRDQLNESDHANGWSANTIKCAEHYCRYQVSGIVTAIIVFLLGKVTMDTIITFSGFRPFGFVKIILGLTIFYLIWLALVLPLSRLTVYFYRQTQSVERFVAKQERSNRRWYNQPIPVTILLMSGVVVGMFPVEFLLHGDVDWPSMRTLSFIALPLVAPIAYFPIRSGLRRSQSWLERMAPQS